MINGEFNTDKINVIMIDEKTTFALVSSQQNGSIAIEKYIGGDRHSCYGTHVMFINEPGNWRDGIVIPDLNEVLIYTPIK